MATRHSRAVFEIQPKPLPFFRLWEMYAYIQRLIVERGGQAGGKGNEEGGNQQAEKCFVRGDERQGEQQQPEDDYPCPVAGFPSLQEVIE